MGGTRFVEAPQKKSQTAGASSWEFCFPLNVPEVSGGGRVKTMCWSEAFLLQVPNREAEAHQSAELDPCPGPPCDFPSAALNLLPNLRCSAPAARTEPQRRGGGLTLTHPCFYFSFSIIYQIGSAFNYLCLLILFVEVVFLNRLVEL